ncbi:MAG: nucleotide exchange factor GrpE [Desulfovibrionaceae bacterium]
MTAKRNDAEEIEIRRTGAAPQVEDDPVDFGPLLADGPEGDPGAGGPAPAAELNLSAEELEDLCRRHVCPNCDVARQAEDKLLRGLADAENLKKRLNREAEEIRKYAGEAVLADLLPVLDNLDLALNHAATHEVCQSFVAGIEITRKVFLDTLAKHGLTPLGERGEPFDPALHEAIGMTHDPSLPADSVGQLVHRGYLLKGRLLRPAKVMVNKPA